MKSWKTTLVGAIGAALTVALPMIGGGPIAWSTVGTAAAIAALGYFAKDAGITGAEK